MPPEPTVEAPNDVKPDEASALALDSSLEKYLEAREATATENATSGVATTATAVAEVDGEAVKLAAEAPPVALRMPAARAQASAASSASAPTEALARRARAPRFV